MGIRKTRTNPKTAPFSPIALEGAKLKNPIKKQTIENTPL
jgi:hypothetical protein